MFLARILPMVRNTFTKTPYNVLHNGLPHRRLCSTTATTSTSVASTNDAGNDLVAELTEKDPDKLYMQIEVTVKAHDPAILRSYGIFAESAANELGIRVAANEAPPKPDFERFPLLKSAHIYKKHQVHYEMRTYYRTLVLKFLTGSTADTYLEYIQRNLPEGVAMVVTKTEIQPLSFDK